MRVTLDPGSATALTDSTGQFTLVGYGLNLNNEVFGFYQGDENYPIQREFYKPTFGGGLRWSPHRER